MEHKAKESVRKMLQAQEQYQITKEIRDKRKESGTKKYYE